MTAPATEYSAAPMAALTAMTHRVSGSLSIETHVDAHDDSVGVERGERSRDEAAARESPAAFFFASLETMPPSPPSPPSPGADFSSPGADLSSPSPSSSSERTFKHGALGGRSPPAAIHGVNTKIVAAQNTTNPVADNAMNTPGTPSVGTSSEIANGAATLTTDHTAA